MTRFRTLAWATVAGVGLATAIAGAALSASPADERQAVMKQVGLTMRDATAFSSGKSPFDAGKVKTLMASVTAASKKLHNLYPAASQSDPKSAADPKVWANKADFDKRLAEMGTLAAAAGKTTTIDAYKPAFAALSGTCKSCHDLYRMKKKS